MRDELYTTLNDDTLVLANIDFITQIGSPGLTDKHYTIYMKSGNKIHVTGDLLNLQQDRGFLIIALTRYLQSPPPQKTI